MPRTDGSVETESRLGVVRGWEGGGGEGWKRAGTKEWWRPYDLRLHWKPLNHTRHKDDSYGVRIIPQENEVVYDACASPFSLDVLQGRNAGTMEKRGCFIRRQRAHDWSACGPSTKTSEPLTGRKEASDHWKVSRQRPILQPAELTVKFTVHSSFNGKLPQWLRRKPDELEIK